MDRTICCWSPYCWPGHLVITQEIGPVSKNHGQNHLLLISILLTWSLSYHTGNRPCVKEPWTEPSAAHDVQFSCAINQPLLAHHCRVHQCLLSSRFIAPSIPWGVSAPGGKMRKQLLKDHNFLNNSPIFIIESSTFNIFAFQKALHTIHFNLKNCFGFGERYLTP